MQGKYETTVGALQDAMKNISNFRKTMDIHTSGPQKEEVQKFLNAIFGLQGLEEPCDHYNENGKLNNKTSCQKTNTLSF